MSRLLRTRGGCIFLALLVGLSCKSRSESNLAADEADAFQELLTITAFRSFSDRVGFHVNVHPAFGQIWNFIAANTPKALFEAYQVKMEGIRALAREMIRRDFPSVRSDAASGDDITLAHLLDKMALGKGFPCQYTPSDPAAAQSSPPQTSHQICYSVDSCEVAIGTLQGFDGVGHTPNPTELSSYVRQRWQQIGDDIACLEPSTRRSLLGYLARSGALRFEFHELVALEPTQKPHISSPSSNLIRDAQMSVHELAQREARPGETILVRLAREIARMEQFYLMPDDPNILNARVAHDLHADFGAAPALKAVFQMYEDPDDSVAQMARVRVEEIERGDQVDYVLNIADAASPATPKGEKQELNQFDLVAGVRAELFATKVAAAHAMNRSLHFYSKRVLHDTIVTQQLKDRQITRPQALAQLGTIQPWLNELRTMYQKWVAWQTRYVTSNEPRPPDLDHVSPSLAFAMLGPFLQYEILLPYRHEYVERMHDATVQMVGTFKASSIDPRRKQDAASIVAGARASIEYIDAQILEAAEGLNFLGTNLIRREKDLASLFPTLEAPNPFQLPPDSGFHSFLHLFASYAESHQEFAQQNIMTHSMELVNELVADGRNIGEAARTASDTVTRSVTAPRLKEDYLRVLGDDLGNSSSQQLEVVTQIAARADREHNDRLTDELARAAKLLQSRGELGRGQKSAQAAQERWAKYMDVRKKAMADDVRLACLNYAVGREQVRFFDTNDKRAVYQCSPALFRAISGINFPWEAGGRSISPFENNQGFSGTLDLEQMCGIRLGENGKPDGPQSLGLIRKRLSDYRANERMLETCHVKTKEFELQMQALVFSMALMPVMGHVGGYLSNIILQRLSQLVLVRAITAGMAGAAMRMSQSRLGNLLVNHAFTRGVTAAGRGVSVASLSSFISALAFQSGTRAAQLAFGFRPDFWDERGFWGDFAPGVARDTFVFMAFGAAHRLGGTFSKALISRLPLRWAQRGQAAAWGIPFATTTVFFAELPTFAHFADKQIIEKYIDPENRYPYLRLADPEIEAKDWWESFGDRYGHAMAITLAFNFYHNAAGKFGVEQYKGPAEHVRLYREALELRDMRLSNPRGFSRTYIDPFLRFDLKSADGRSQAEKLFQELGGRREDAYWWLGITKEEAFHLSSNRPGTKIPAAVADLRFERWLSQLNGRYRWKKRQYEKFVQHHQEAGNEQHVRAGKVILSYLENVKNTLSNREAKDAYDSFVFDSKFPEGAYGQYDKRSSAEPEPGGPSLPYPRFQ